MQQACCTILLVVITIVIMHCSLALVRRVANGTAAAGRAVFVGPALRRAIRIIMVILTSASGGGGGDDSRSGIECCAEGGLLRSVRHRIDQLRQQWHAVLAKQCACGADVMHGLQLRTAEAQRQISKLRKGALAQVILERLRHAPPTHQGILVRRRHQSVADVIRSRMGMLRRLLVAAVALGSVRAAIRRERAEGLEDDLLPPRALDVSHPVIVEAADFALRKLQGLSESGIFETLRLRAVHYAAIQVRSDRVCNCATS